MLRCTLYHLTASTNAREAIFQDDVRKRGREEKGALLDVALSALLINGNSTYASDGAIATVEHFRKNSCCGFECKDILFTFVYLYDWSSEMQVSKWGNSLAVRLPASVVEVLGLKEGDNIEIHVVASRVLEVKKTPGARELLARVRKYRGRLPADFKFDRLEAHERG